MKTSEVVCAVAIVSLMCLFGNVSALATEGDPSPISRQLDVMKGIVRSTLATAPAVSGSSFERSPSRIPVDAYHLRGQGAVLIVSLPRGARSGFPGLTLATTERYEAELDAVRADLLAREKVESELLAAQQARVEAAAAMMAAKAAEANSAQQSADAARAFQELTAKLNAQTQQAEAAQRNLEARLREEKQRAEARRREAQQMAEVAALKKTELDERAGEMVDLLTGEVLEMLAGYGDSIGALGREERVVVILRSSGSSSLFASRGAEAPSARIVSVTKGDVLELKSGKISRESFDERALVYDD